MQRRNLEISREISRTKLSQAQRHHSAAYRARACSSNVSSISSWATAKNRERRYLIMYRQASFSQSRSYPGTLGQAGSHPLRSPSYLSSWRAGCLVA